MTGGGGTGGDSFTDFSSGTAESPYTHGRLDAQRDGERSGRARTVTTGASLIIAAAILLIAVLLVLLA